MDTVALVEKVIDVLRKTTSSNIKYDRSDESGNIYVNVKNEPSDCDYSIHFKIVPTISFNINNNSNRTTEEIKNELYKTFSEHMIFSNCVN